MVGKTVDYLAEIKDKSPNYQPVTLFFIDIYSQEEKRKGGCGASFFKNAPAEIVNISNIMKS